MIPRVISLLFKSHKCLLLITYGLYYLQTSETRGIMDILLYKFTCSFLINLCHFLTYFLLHFGDVALSETHSRPKLRSTLRMFWPLFAKKSSY